MPIRSVTLRIGGDAAGARRAGAEADAIANAIDAAKPTLHIGAELPEGALASLRAQVDALTAVAHDLNIGLDVSGLAKLAAVNMALVKLTTALEGRSDISVRNFAKFQSELARAAVGLEAIGKMHEEPTIDVHVDTGNLQTLMGRLGHFTLGTLFSGGLLAFTSIHYIIDGLVELAAVVVPATLGLAAFGIAAYHTFDLIGIHLNNIYTVGTALNRVIYPMSQGFKTLQAQIRPDVMQLFGDALTIVNKNTGAFASLAKQAGAVVDNWGARIAIVATQSNGVLGGLVKGAGHDLTILGNLFGSIAGSLANLFVAAEHTHIAEDLFSVIGVAAKLLNLFTELPGPILVSVLALHGIYLWGKLALAALGSFGNWMLTPWRGLAGTVANVGTRFGFFGQKALDVAATLGVADPMLEKIHGNIEKTGIAADTVGGKIGFFASKMGVAAGDTGALAGAANLLDAVPVWGWVAAGVVALGALTYVLLRTKTATQQWIDSLQAGIMNTPITGGINKLYSDLGQVTAALSASTKQTASFGHATVTTSEAIFNNGSAMQQSFQKTQNLTGAQKQLLGQSNLLIFRLGTLSHSFGISLSGAMAIAQLAGVKMSTMLDKSHTALLMVEYQVGALIQGYKAMGSTTGMVGADINAMTVATSDQLTAITKLNSAFDTFTSMVAGPRSGFITFAQSLVQFSTDAKVAGARVTGFGGAVQGVARHVTTASLQLQQDFQATFTNANALFDAMRTSGASGAAMTRTVKEAVAVLLPLAGHSKVALAEVSALAQEVGGPYTDSAKKMWEWTGKIPDPLKKMEKGSNNAAIAVANLSGDAAKLSTTLSQDLNSMIGKVILSTSSVQGAMVKYTNDLRNNTSTTVQGVQDRQNLYNDLMKIFHNSTTANQAIRILTQGTLGLHSAMSQIHNISDTVSLTGHGTFSIAQVGSLSKPGGKLSGPGGKVAAMGMRVPGWGGGDNYPAMLEGGEAVVPKHLVPTIAPFLHHHGVPGFAAGGYMGAIGGMGPWVTAQNKNYDSSFLSKFESTMSAAMASAIAAAKAAAISTGGGGFPGGHGSLGIAERAWMGGGGPGGMTAHIAGAITGAESGFNPNAIQQGQPYATTGWGAWQITPGNSEPQAGVNQGLLNWHSNAIAAVAKYRQAGGSFSPWTTYEDGAYLRFMASGGLVGKYDQGGWLPPGLSLALNATGIPEPVGRTATGHHGDIYYITVKGDTNPDGAALAIIQKIRDYKRHHGNKATGIG